MPGERIDMSLDDIIKANRGGNRGGGKRGKFNRSAPLGPHSNFRKGKMMGKHMRKPLKGTVKKRRRSDGGAPGIKSKNVTQMLHLVGGRGRRPPLPGMRKRSASLGSDGGITKLLISNLDFGVNDDDIKELFAQCGNMKKASVHFDQNGKSLGTADVVYERRSDAMKALKQYNNVALDGRPMRIEVVGDITKSSPFKKSRFGQRGGLRGGRGAFRGGRGGRGRGAGKPAPSRETLDAQLDAYSAKK